MGENRATSRSLSAREAQRYRLRALEAELQVMGAINHNLCCAPCDVMGGGECCYSICGLVDCYSQVNQGFPRAGGPGVGPTAARVTMVAQSQPRMVTMACA